MKVNLIEALGDLNEDAVMKGVKEIFDAGVPSLEILASLQKGMEKVGERYESKEYFLSELIMSAEIFKNAAAIVGSVFTESTEKKLGTFVIGTVSEDIHDIGKNIVATIMSCNGFNVVDLGVDVPEEKFIEAIKEHNPQVVGMSCLLTTAFDNMKNTIVAIESAGLRDGRKILIGGGPIDQSVVEYVNADGFCVNAQEAVDVCKKIVTGYFSNEVIVLKGGTSI